MKDPRALTAMFQLCIRSFCSTSSSSTTTHEQETFLIPMKTVPLFCYLGTLRRETDITFEWSGLFEDEVTVSSGTTQSQPPQLLPVIDAGNYDVSILPDIAVGDESDASIPQRVVSTWTDERALWTALSNLGNSIYFLRDTTSTTMLQVPDKKTLKKRQLSEYPLKNGLAMFYHVLAFGCPVEVSMAPCHLFRILWKNLTPSSSSDSSTYAAFFSTPTVVVGTVGTSAAVPRTEHFVSDETAEENVNEESAAAAADPSIVVAAAKPPPKKRARKAATTTTTVETPEATDE
jgi:hypothetical protein